MNKPKTPYQRLLEEFGETWDKVQYAHRATMFRFPKDDMERRVSWQLWDVDQRVQAAKQLGYDVLLEHRDDGLYVVYRKSAPDRPWVIR